MTDREAYIILNMISGVGTVRLRALMEVFACPAEIFSQPAARLAGISGISSKLANKIANWRNEIDLSAELETAAKGGAEIITLDEDSYPAPLKDIYDPPLCLYVRGKLPKFNPNTIAIVGSRRVTVYGKKMARHLSEAAALAGWTVVSGLAYGVDGIAHQAAVDAGGITAAVLGSGLLRVHPQDHIPLARSIIDTGGAIISEFPMNFPASRQSFPRRNRIVSGLSSAVLIIEAGLESGALITAQLGLDQGKSVFAVPGHVDNPQARGCHKLIKDGATLTESFDDIVGDLEFLPGFSPKAGGAEEESEDRNYFDLAEDESKIVELLKIEEKSFESLAIESGIAAGNLLSIMMKLEIKMIVNQLPGKIYTLR